MTAEELEAGNQLLTNLKNAKGQLSAWTNAKKFTYDKINITDVHNKDFHVPVGVINFEVVKTLVVAELTKQVDKLQREFNNL